jgi:PEP-CTERM motif
LRLGFAFEGMKTTILLASALFLAATLPATTVVHLPGNRATTEGNGATFIGTFFGSNTIQVQIAEAELIALGLQPGFSVTGLSWRLNGAAATNSADAIISDLEILLGQAVNTVGGMSTTFADNVMNGVLVHDGSYTIAANSMPGGGTPNAFGPAIQFSVGYTYQGGDLIVQIRRQPASAGMGLDASSDHDLAGTTYQAVTGTFAGTAGSLTNHFPVMQLQVETPEPGAWSLMVLGLGLVGAGWRRRPRA